MKKQLFQFFLASYGLILAHAHVLEEGDCCSMGSGKVRGYSHFLSEQIFVHYLKPNA